MKPDKPSRTATIVAGGLQLACAQAGLPADALPGDARRMGEQLFRRVHPRLAALLRKAWFQRLCHMLERATLPGICLHFALRKQLLRRHARAALAGGCTQVVVLGAGFDTLCMELKAARPELRCFEIDHPATQAARRRAGSESDDGIGFIAADLARHELGVLLRAQAGFRTDASTLFVAEGLLMYIPLDAVRALFAQMAAAAPDCRVAFTWFEPRADGHPGFHQRSRLIDSWLRWRGEPFMSGMARAGLDQFLSAAGFVLEDLKSSGDLLDSGYIAQRPIEGEYIALASAAHNQVSAH